MKKPNLILNSSDLFKMIREKFPLPVWAVFGEVGNGTGSHVSRHADAVAVCLWPSRGLEIHGFEIKCYRGDWLKELATPQKADAVQKYCDRWWIVVKDEGIVKDEELPPTWGLLQAKNGKLDFKKQAPKLSPEPLNVAFLAAILRRQAEATEKELTYASQQARKEGYEEGAALGPDQFRNKIENLKQTILQHEKTIKDFEETSGLSINQWDAGRIGEEVKKLMKLRYSDPFKSFEQLKTSALSVAKECENHLQTIREVV